VDKGPDGTGVDLGSQAVDINVNDVREWVKVFIPYVIRNVRPGYYPSLPENQKLDQRVFLRRKPDGAARPQNGVARGIDGQVGDMCNRRPPIHGAADQGSHSRQQFLELKRLYKVIVGAGIETGNTIV
jgi:hypothetical protein